MELAGAPVRHLHPASTALGLGTGTALSWVYRGGTDVVGKLRFTVTTGSQHAARKARGTQMPGGWRGFTLCQPAAQGWQGCAAGRGRRRMPAPLSYFPG